MARWLVLFISLSLVSCGTKVGGRLTPDSDQPNVRMSSYQFDGLYGLEIDFCISHLVSLPVMANVEPEILPVELAQNPVRFEPEGVGFGKLGEYAGQVSAVNLVLSKECGYTVMLKNAFGTFESQDEQIRFGGRVDIDGETTLLDLAIPGTFIESLESVGSSEELDAKLASLKGVLLSE